MPHSWRQNKTLSIMNIHCLLRSKSNAKSEHWRIFKTQPEDISSQNSLSLFVHICQVQCVCSNAFNAGWGESRWPFDGSSIGTNGLQGVRLIRLLYCAVMIACQIYSTAAPSKLFQSIVASDQSRSSETCVVRPSGSLFQEIIWSF